MITKYFRLNIHFVMLHLLCFLVDWGTCHIYWCPASAPDYYAQKRIYKYSLHKTCQIVSKEKPDYSFLNHGNRFNHLKDVVLQNSKKKDVVLPRPSRGCIMFSGSRTVEPIYEDASRNVWPLRVPNLQIGTSRIRLRDPHV